MKDVNLHSRKFHLDVLIPPGNFSLLYTAMDILTLNTDLATANATLPGIPQNDLTACRINETEGHNGPFCSPIQDQNLFTGYTYGGKWKALVDIRKLTIFSDVELEAVSRECFGNSRIDLYHGRSTARVVILQCAEYTGLCQCVP